MLQKSFSNRPTTIELADKIVLFNPRIVEESLTKWRIPTDQQYRLNRDAWLIHIN